MKTQTAPQTVTEATFIPFRAAPGREGVVAALLAGAAEVVRKTEPGTLQWLSLRNGEGRFAIADFFPDAKARSAHFAGQVAAALKDAADGAVEGGWEQGIVAHVENARVLAARVRKEHALPARTAVRIELEAKPGQAEALARFLAAAAGVVEETEPDTLLWYALRVSESRFVIFDVFPGAEAQAAHFAGQAAAALRAKAEALVEGGWEGGVVARVQAWEVLSAAC